MERKRFLSNYNIRRLFYKHMPKIQYLSLIYIVDQITKFYFGNTVFLKYASDLESREFGTFLSN